LSSAAGHETYESKSGCDLRVGVINQMASYISSNANRFYTALESAYGTIGTITAANRIPAVKLTVKQQLEVLDRKDKTGSRTFAGLPAGGRKRTNFELRTYLTSWAPGSTGPAYGPLFQAALGGVPSIFGGGVVASYSAGRLGFASPHGLSAGQAVMCGGEVRFAAAIVDGSTVQLNAPLTTAPAAGAAIGPTVTYAPATELPSVSVFDYWSPATAVQRLLSGGAVNQLEIEINGDYHEFHFSGVAQDVLDSASFTAGAASQLSSFPSEPALGAFDLSIVPGNMGEAWLGSTPAQFFTITNATLSLKNNLDTRMKEFGSNLPLAIAPGERNVEASLELYSLDDSATAGLYQAARQQYPISVMFQLGETAGQLMGVYLKSVVPVVPQFDDSSNRLQWQFRSSRAQGTVDDEIAVAFG
jgi:Phage tail tube protein